MTKTMLIVASTLGLVLGASQFAAAAPAANGAMKTAIDSASPVENVGYHYRRHHYRYHHRPQHRGY